MRTISTIARDISRNWENVNYAARPYLNAMYELEGPNDYVMSDSARSIVLYFLGNASSFRGPIAKALKLELKTLCNIK